MRIETKLVRDRIPELLLSDGRLLRVRRVHGKELCRYLIIKLREEVEELSNSLSIEEVADILEVLEELARSCLRVEWGEVLRVKNAKRVERGGFSKGLIATYIARD